MLLQCKQTFDIRPNCKIRETDLSDLKPHYIISEVQRLCDELTAYSGRPSSSLDKYLK